MTNLQLLLSIGIPSVLVVLGWLQTNTRLGRLETTVDRHDSKNDARFERLSADIVTLRADLNRDMTNLRNDLNRDMTNLRNDLNREMVALRDSIHRDMITLHERVAVVETKSA